MQVFMGDTSYSAGTLWDFSNNDEWTKIGPEILSDPKLGLTNLPIENDNSRGISVSEVLINIPSGDLTWGSDSRVFIHGILR